MTDPFVEKSGLAGNVSSDDEFDLIMSRVEETTTGTDSASAAEQIRQTLGSKRVCPFCGHQAAHGNEPCPRCTMEDSPATRQATKTRIGPWYVLQSRNPAAPGMKYATLLALINKGHVTPRSIVRGPTTHQMWRYAAHVRGISREFGLCFSCGGASDRNAAVCQHCQRSQEAPPDPDVLIETKAVVPSAVASPAAQEQFNEQPASSFAQRMRDLNRQRTLGEVDPRGDTNLAGPITPRRTDMARRQTDGRIVSAMELAAALQDDPENALRNPRWRMMKIAAATLLLLGLAATAVMVFFPEYRQSTWSWFSDTSESVKSKWLSIQWQGTKSATPTEAARDMPIAAASTPAPPVPAESSPPPVAAVVADPLPVVESVSVSPPSNAPTAPVASQIRIEPPASPPLTESITLSQAPDPLELSRSLWRKALEADAARNYTEEISLLEQIQKIPGNAKGSAVEMQLKIARDLAAQSSSSQ